MRRVLLLLCTFSLLSACDDSTDSLTQLKRAPANESVYQSALAAQYRDFSSEKEGAYQWKTSKYFADKGLSAAYGQPLEPEDPLRWDTIPEAAMPDLLEGRARLMDVLPNAAQYQSQEAAAAVATYDRWVVLAAGGWEAVKIEEVRDQFYTILGLLEEAAKNPPPKPVETTSTVLYFPFDRAQLSGSARMALDQLVESVKGAGNVGITINGHADRAGSEEYNMKLSQERALFVRDALLKAGVPDHLIRYYAFGETDPDVPTADGVPEPLNRRVEIFIE